MENENNFVCSLCCCTISENITEKIDDTTKEMLNVIFVNKNFRLDKGQLLCQPCSRQVQDTFDFKYRCISTENFLAPFASAAANPQVDLWEICKRQNLENETDLVGNRNVCRLCLQIINGPVNSLLVQTEFDMIQKYVPEIMIHNTSDPVACDACISHLHNLAGFIFRCVQAQERKNKRQEVDTTEREKCNRNLFIKITSEDFYNVKRFEPSAEQITNAGNYYNRRYWNEHKVNSTGTDKCERDLIIKIEDVCKVKRSKPTATTEDITNIGNHYNRSFHPLPIPADTLQMATPILQQSQEMLDIDETPSFLYDLDLRTVKALEKNSKKQSKTEKYKNGRFYCKSSIKKYRDPSKIKTYNCEHCDYNTTYLNAIKSHMLNHMEPSAIKWYSCTECKYKTKYPNALKSHKLKHTLPSKIQMRKCEQCPYETKHRTALVLHMLKHTEPSEIQLYKCDRCKFQTKFKHALKPHKQKHRKVSF